MAVTLVSEVEIVISKKSRMGEWGINLVCVYINLYPISTYIQVYINLVCFYIFYSTQERLCDYKEQSKNSMMVNTHLLPLELPLQLLD